MNIASDPVDVQDLQFKLQCRLKIFDNNEDCQISISKNLVATASRFGLFFVGCNTPQLKVIRFASIEDYACNNPVTNYSRREITLPSPPQHICVNCDSTILAVVIEKDTCPVAIFYDVQSFVKQTVVVINEIRLSKTAGVKVLEANWHPTQSQVFTECKSDGSLGIYELKDKSVEIKTLPGESNASCFCWSPKGKQIAVGSKDGKLTHYKPDLKAVKVINAPPFDKPYTIISLQWISNYQFIGAFKPIDNLEDQCCIVVIDAPKTGNPTFTNFYDVCYSSGKYRSPQFYLLLLQHWNIMVVSSANSMEVGVLANSNDVWTQWSLSDSARAELPLDENRSETFPIGISVDTSSVKPVPWGETCLQPAPSLLLLSNKGILCCFKIINLKEKTPSINSPPENIADLSGLGAFTTGSVSSTKDVPTKPTEVQPDSQPKPNLVIQEPKPQVIQQPKPQLVIPQPKPQQIIQQPKPQQAIQPSQQQTSNQVLQLNDPRSMIPTATQATPTLFSQVTQTTVQQNLVQIQPSPMSSFSAQTAPKSSAMNLFGGQVTITPTNKEKQQSTSSSLVGSMLLSNMNSSKPTLDKPSISITLNPNVPVQVSSTSAPKAKIEIPAKTSTLPEPVMQKSNLNTETQNENSTASNQTNNEDIESILTRMIQMECAALEKELDIVLFQGKQIKISLDPKDMDKIVNSTKDLEEFTNELVETSDIQSSEIHILKQNMIQSWAWLEEAKSRLNEYKNEEIKILMKSRPLDSVSEKHLHTLQQMEYYLDSQLNQAQKALDEQWDIFQEYCKKINRIQLPTMEAIFQTMVKQNAILQKHDYILKDFSSQLKGKRRASDFPLFNPLNKNKSLEDSFQNLKLEADDIYHIYYQKVMNRVKPLPCNKSSQLRRMLHNREVPHVKVKSHMTTSILQKTPEKNRLISAQVTPISKNPELSKKLNFYQSTPLNIKPAPFSTTQLNSSPSSAFAPTNSASQTSTQKGLVFKMPSDSAEPNTGGSVLSAPIGTISALKNSTNKLTDEKTSIFGGQISSMNLKEDLSVASSSMPLQCSTAQTTQTGSFPSKPSTFVVTSSNISTPKTSFFFEQSNIERQTPIHAKPTISAASDLSSTGGKISDSITDKSFGFLPEPVKTSLFTPITSLLVSATPATSTEVYTDSTGINKTVTPITSSIFGKAVFSGSQPTVDTESQVGSSNSGMHGADTKLSKEVSSSVTTLKPAPTVANTSVSSSLPFLSAAKNVSTVVPKTSNMVFTPIVLSPPESIKMSTASQPMFSSPVASTVPIADCTSSTPNIPGTANIAVSSASAPSKTSDVFGVLATSAEITSVTGTSSLPGSLFGSTSTTSGSLFGLNPSVPAISATSANIFGSTAPTSSGSIFGVSSSVPKPTENLFGTTASAATTISFGAISSTSSTSSGSIFGNSLSTGIQKTSGSLFSSSASPAVTSTVTGSLFSGATDAPGNVFGSKLPSASATSESAATGVFAPTAAATSSASKSIFGSSSVPSTMNSNNQNPSSSSSVFASPQSGSVFGTPSSPSTNSPFVKVAGTADNSSFGVSGASAPNSGSLFRQDSTGNTKSIFGNASANTSNNNANSSPFASSLSTPATTTSSIFGNAFGASNPTGSTFGAPTSSSVPATVSSSVFGSPSNSSFAPSPFGATASSPFGTASVSTTSAFGTPTTATFGGAAGNTSAFGQVSTSTASPFGNTATSQAPAFGQVSTSTASPFGNTATSQALAFGQVSTSTASPFGNTATSQAPAFGQTSVFGSSFGQTTANSVFGQGTSNNVFGGTTTSATSPFGTAATSSPFNQTSPSGGLFGSSPFGSAGNSENSGTSFGFGSLNVGSSTQSPFGKKDETKSPFGGSNFNAAASTGSLFGSSGSVFGQSSTFGNTFSGSQQPGPFSGGPASATAAGFGAAPGFQKPSGFGAQPSFGGAPAFGSSPTFGGAPTFGNTSPFGSPNKVFGSASPTGVFGTNNQASPGFGNLASQNTIGFGNLAQQTVNNPNQNSPFSGNSSFSSWR